MEQTVTKAQDSRASSYITQKDVILCRSGIQLYHKSEIASFITDSNRPAQDKEWYREYRPASVVVKAASLCRMLPVSREHPSDWISPDNFRELAGGVTDNAVEVVALDGEAKGEIGLKSNITFFTRDLYDYYNGNNKEVSLGYTCTKHFVDDPDCGYDIILDSIDEVNHLAITKSGRGGSSVAVIDSMIGGMRPMRTGIWQWLKSRRQTDSAQYVFSSKVFDALRASAGKTAEEVEKNMQGVLDSISDLMDGDAKKTLCDMVRDCCDASGKAIENEKELSPVLDSLYKKAVEDSVANVNGAVADTKVQDAKEDEKEEKKDETGEKTEEKGEKDEEKAEDSASPKQSDSVGMTKEEIACLVKDSVAEAVRETVPQTVKAVLGIKDAKDGKDGGMQVDSAPVFARDYSEFLDM